MAAIYVRWIQAGKMVLDDVPERWRGRVSAILKERETNDQS